MTTARERHLRAELRTLIRAVKRAVPALLTLREGVLARHDLAADRLVLKAIGRLLGATGRAERHGLTRAAKARPAKSVRQRKASKKATC